VEFQKIDALHQINLHVAEHFCRHLWGTWARGPLDLTALIFLRSLQTPTKQTLTFDSTWFPIQ